MDNHIRIILYMCPHRQHHLTVADGSRGKDIRIIN